MNHWKFVLLVVMISAPALLAQFNGELSGRVTDKNTGEPVYNALVNVEGTAQKEYTNRQGYFRVQHLPRGIFNVLITAGGYVDGYLEDVTFEENESRTINIKLESTPVSLNNITVVSPSRGAEKALPAPAATTVIDHELLDGAVYPGASEILQDIAGVDEASTGIDQRELVLRSFNNPFSGKPYLLSDHRQTALPGLGINLYSILPNVYADIEQVEIVQGPGAATYGARGGNGVIHYLSKDPFTRPGTALSIAGGERDARFGSFRHAYSLFNTVGYKVTAQYARADDWALDPGNRFDRKELARDDPSVTRNYDYERLNLNGMLQFKFNDAVRLTAQGGYARFDGNILSDIGTTRIDSLVNTYGQVRLNAGGFFAQAYVNQNRGGNYVLYSNNDTLVDKSTQVFGQAQYQTSLLDGRWQVLTGVDVDRNTPDSDSTRYGRNEADTEMNILGAYFNTSFNIFPKLSLNTALRMDQNDVFDDTRISPRVGLVYSPTPLHAIRATFNQATDLPGNDPLFLDIKYRESLINQNGNYQIAFQARGARKGFRFDDFRQNRQVISFAALSNNTLSTFGETVSFDEYPVAPVLLFAAENTATIFNGPAEGVPASLRPFDANQRDALVQLLTLLGQQAFSAKETTGAILGFPDSRREFGYREVEELRDIEPLGVSTSSTFELGYKGLLANRLLISASGYYTTRKNFVGPMMLETPYVYLPADFVRARVIDFITSDDPQVASLVGQLGIGPVATIATMTNIYSKTASGIVHPDAGEDGLGILQTSAANQIGALLTFRNFGKIQYFGADLDLQFMARHDLFVFGNVSAVNDNFFDNKELEETDTELSLALNAPTVKLKFGVLYHTQQALTLGATIRYTKGFPVQSGPYISGLPEPYGNDVGGVESIYVLDVNAGYNLSGLIPGLRFDMSVKNVYNLDYREFAGAPPIGRLALAQLSASF